MEISQQYINITQIIANLVTSFAIFFAVYQIILARKANYFQICEKIYLDNIRIRKTITIAQIQLQVISTEIKKDNVDLSMEYHDDKYSQLREVAHHYEFIGILVKNKMVPFNLVFNLVPFPDTLWKDAQDFMNIMKENWMQDFWENFQFLHEKYIVERKRKNFYKIKKYIA